MKAGRSAAPGEARAVRWMGVCVGGGSVDLCGPHAGYQYRMIPTLPIPQPPPSKP